MAGFEIREDSFILKGLSLSEISDLSTGLEMVNGMNAVNGTESRHGQATDASGIFK